MKYVLHTHCEHLCIRIQGVSQKTVQAFRADAEHFVET